MGEKGPSPLIPCLVVAALGWFICGPTIADLLESLVSVLRIGEEIEGRVAFSVLMLMLLFLLVFVYLLSSYFPTLGMSSFASTQQASGSDSDGIGFGFGALLLFVLFCILYNLFWALTMLVLPICTKKEKEKGYAITQVVWTINCMLPNFAFFCYFLKLMACYIRYPKCACVHRSLVRVQWLFFTNIYFTKAQKNTNNHFIVLHSGALNHKKRRSFHFIIKIYW